VFVYRDELTKLLLYYFFRLHDKTNVGWLLIRYWACHQQLLINDENRFATRVRFIYIGKEKKRQKQ